MHQTPAKNYNMTQGSLAAWTRLLNAADEINKLALWDIFCEVDLAEVLLPGDTEPYYCCISGMFESPKGVSIYKGHMGLVSFSHYLNGIEMPDYIAESKRHCLECTWGPRADLRKRDMDVVKACERKYRGKEAWPIFRKHEPGYEPWFISDREAMEFAGVLEELVKAAKQLVSSESVAVMGNGYRISRRFDYEAAQYVNEFLPPIDKVEAVTEGCVITDELLIRRLRKKPCDGAVLEFDMPYLPMSVKGKGKDPRPFFPRMCIICDTRSGATTEQYMISRHDDPRDVALGLIIVYIEKYGRPSKIYVRDPEIFGIIGHLCSSVDIEVTFTPALHMLDYFIDDMVTGLSDDETDI